jgi:hypothetical protein
MLLDVIVPLDGVSLLGSADPLEVAGKRTLDDIGGARGVIVGDERVENTTDSVKDVKAMVSWKMVVTGYVVVKVITLASAVGMSAGVDEGTMFAAAGFGLGDDVGVTTSVDGGEVGGGAGGGVLGGIFGGTFRGGKSRRRCRNLEKSRRNIVGASLKEIMRPSWGSGVGEGRAARRRRRLSERGQVRVNSNH